MARILFTTFGSYGDLHPYMAVGLELRARGHAVTIATSASYRAKVESEGLRFHAVRPDGELGNSAIIEYVMDARHGSERVLRWIGAVVRESYDDTLPAMRVADIAVTQQLAFAAVLAARKLGVPWVSTVLAPVSLLSVYDPPVPPQAPWLVTSGLLGPRAIGAVWKLGKPRVARWLRGVTELERELGLNDGGNPVFEGSYSPRLVLALFSRCLAAPQRDWPAATVVTGFPFFDQHHEHRGLPAELERFLADGAAPVVFTLGSSAVAAAGDFYRESLRAAGRLGVRAVFLTGAHPQGLPEKLPRSVLAVEWAAHSEIFPRAVATVHQCGIGTTAQAMRSGRPMVCVPFAHDQFDNAERVRRLGAAEVVYRSRYNARRAEKALSRVLGGVEYRAAAARVGEQVRAERGAAMAADRIEEVLHSPRTHGREEVSSAE